MDSANGNYINGRWVSSSDNQTYEQRNPADLTEITGRWPKSTVQDTQQAIQAGERAFGPWSALTVYQRHEYLRKALEVMEKNKTCIAQMITRENGKTVKESQMEIESSRKEMEFLMHEGLRMAGTLMPSRVEGVLAYSIRVPLGVVGIISPWNFPFNVPCRKVIPALMMGNTCILKPANLTPGCGAEFVKLFEQAGLSAGVLNLVTGSGSIIGGELVANPAVKAVSFTGSTEVGRQINQGAAATFTRTQLEMGGKNPMIVLADADLEKAVDDAVLAGFACAGQWCTSTSRIILEKSIADDFLTLLLERTARITVGKGTEEKTQMGPVCGQGQMDSILAAIERGKHEGATLIAGGRRISTEGLQHGCFIEPTLFSDVTPDMYLAQEEIFGPVLSILTVSHWEEALEVANGVKYGLSSSIYTRDLEKAFRFLEQTEAGITHVNMPTAHKEAQLSFGGVKLSGHGIPESGKTGFEFFSEHKVIYIKY